MNFMPVRPWFCEEVINPSRSSTSSSSSSLHHRTALPPYSCAVVRENETPDESSDDRNIFSLARAAGVGDGSSTPALSVQTEHMFDKVVTPSDVGKLNRLVIPKQHAERHFPLDSSTNEKGLLLNFEDRNGKPWRFRYSYWNSSQSYVMTKGWSRFVKEKKLDAGDIVSFQRGVGEIGKDRLFIDWRRRPGALPPNLPHGGHHFSFHRPPRSHPVVNPWGGPSLFIQPPPSGDQLYSDNNSGVTMPHHHYQYHPHLHHPYGYIVNGNPCPPGSIMYLRSNTGGVRGGGGGVLAPGGPHTHNWEGLGGDEVFQSVPVVQGKAAAKRLRLFGVNMDCPIPYPDDDNINECDMSLFSSAIAMRPPRPSQPAPVDPSSLAGLRSKDDDGKGKGSMSLDLDI